jgi:hypothetical protein
VRLSRVDWTDRPPLAHTIHRTGRDTEDLILSVRRELKERSALGECGAVAIQRTLRAQSHVEIPTVRTIGRILERRGAIDYRRRVRRPSPAPGWYLRDVVDRRAELDSFDIVEGLRLPDDSDVDVLTGTSLHGHLVGAWPGRIWTARHVVTTLVTHWRDVGLPAYAQFDNDNRFQGPHQHADVVGRVMRLCLSLHVVPVFAPPREPGFQNAVENFNGLWQAKVWARFTHDTLRHLSAQSARYVIASRQRAAARHDQAHHVPRFLATGRLICRRPCTGASSFCGVPRNGARCRCWGITCRSTRNGVIGWCVAKFFLITSASAFMPCAARNPMRSRCYANSRIDSQHAGSKSDPEALSCAKNHHFNDPEALSPGLRH